MHHTGTRGEEEEEHRWEWLLYALQLPSLCGVNHGTGTVCRNFRKPHRLRAGGITKSEVAVGGRERTGQHSVPPPPPPRRCLAEGVATPKRRRVGLVNRAAEEVGGILFIFLSQVFFTHVVFYRNSNSFQMFGSKEKEETQRKQSEQCKQREERQHHLTGTHRGPNCNSTLVSPHCRVPLKSPLKQKEQEQQEQHQ
jgi:hypothetical protein